MTNQVEWKATQKLSVKESYQGTAGMASDWLPVPIDSPEGSDWLSVQIDQLTNCVWNRCQ